MGVFGRGAPSDGLDADALQSFHTAAARTAQRIALQTADAWSSDDLVRVWVNAHGVVVQAEVDEDLLLKASAAELAEAMVNAAQAAAVKVREQVATIQAVLWQQLTALGAPDMQMIEDIAEFQQLRPTVPLSAPDSRERRTAAGDLMGTSAGQPWRVSVSAS